MTDDLADLAKKRQQRRKRQASGVEQITAFVYMPKFIAWLIWEGYLDSAAQKLPPAEFRAAVTRAVEQHLYRCYSPLAELCPSPNLSKWPEYARVVVNWPGYAKGTLAQDFTAIREKPDPEASWPYPLVGSLEREGELAEAFGLSQPFLLTRRRAALRQAVPIPMVDPPDAELSSYSGEASTFDVATPNPWYRGDDYDDPQADANYDPEIDVAEESADMLDEAVASIFDAEGYEQE